MAAPSSSAGVESPLPQTLETATAQPPVAESEPGVSPGIDDNVARIGSKLVEEKRQDKEWDAKTCRQAEMIFDLFDRFPREECKLEGLSRLKQQHLNAFNGFLRVLFKSYGKSPQDKMRSIAELRRISAEKPVEQRGLAGGTRNRHLTFLGQLLRRARSAGLPLTATSR
jgi:hypothetical protein